MVLIEESGLNFQGGLKSGFYCTTKKSHDKVERKCYKNWIKCKFITGICIEGDVWYKGL